MNDLLFTPIRLSELELLIQNSVEKALKLHPVSQYPSTQPEQLLTIEEAAEFMRLSKATLYSKVSKGDLPFMKRSKRLYFSRTELLDYIKEGRKKTNSEIEEEANTYLKNRK